MLSKMWCFVLVFLCINYLVRCEDSVYVNCASPSVSDVNGQTYKFYDGEKVFIWCPNSISRILSDSFPYIGNNNTVLQMGKERTTYLYIKLYKNSNNKYVKCETYDDKNKQYSNTTLYFKSSDTSTSSRDPSSETSCDKKQHFVKTLEKCYTKSLDDEILNHNCTFPGNASVPVITGLLEDKIMAVFFKNKKNMIIVYEYNKMGEEFNLKCTHEWEKDSSVQDISKPENNFHTFKINHSTMTDLTCKSGESSTKIIFKLETQQRITSTAKEPGNDVSSRATNPSYEPVEDPKKTADLQGGTNNGDTKQPPILRNDPGHGILIIGGGVCIVILVMVIVFVFLIKIFKKKPKTPTPDVNINYETLPEHNQGAMPIPRQWQEVQYALPDDRIANNDYAVPHQPTLEEMYTKPLPKNARNNTLGNNTLRNNTAGNNTLRNNTVGNNTMGNNTLRNNTLGNYTRDNLGYESVDELFPPKSNSRPTLKKVLPTPAKRVQPKTTRVKFDDNYSDTASESPYAEVNYEEANAKTNLGYSNVFSGQRYVNSNSNKIDYAEPAYCEPTKVSK